TSAGAHAKPRDSTIFISLQSRGQCGQIRLVDEEDLRQRARGNLPENAIDLSDLHVLFFAGGIHHMQQQVRLYSLLERRAEGGDERGGQIAYEADSVGQHDISPSRRM